MWLDQRSHGKAERSGTEVPNFMDCESTAWSKEGNQTITSLYTDIHGAGCGLDRVWIGLDPGLDRPGPRIEPTFLCILQLGCACGKKRTTRWRQQVDTLAAWQPGLATASAWQLDSLVAWEKLQFDSLKAWLNNTCSLAAWQLDCLAAWLCNKCSLEVWQLGTVALKQFVAWLLGRVNNCRHQLAHK